ncbi:hypothetical protein H0H81_002917 [Sphagnurus paluster]|uniref:F-box domain-containing protein n=1 Tax=Sphagnurus paluster TaxID=117069 RepID=A0A9P7K2R4_9AGAR|nr:hypothetical protein H0H81_002917 [Sphagnurus paluster]
MKLPAEIVDHIIDYLGSLNPKALSACSLVSSQWLRRCRYHLFSTVHLGPCRLPLFKNLLRSPSCTLTRYVSHIEIDGSSKPSNASAPTVSAIIESISIIQHSRFSRITSVRLQNIDWTALHFQEQTAIKRSLSRMTTLTRLEFHRIEFHDLREAARMLASLPSVRHTTFSHILFTKYADQAVAAAARLRLPTHLTSIELGPGDAVPSVLACLATHSIHEAPCIRALSINGLRRDDVAHLNSALSVIGPQLQQLKIAFWEGGTSENAGVPGAPSGCIDLRTLENLRCLSLDLDDATHVDRTQGPVAALTSILSTLSSSELQSVDLVVRPSSTKAVACAEWRELDVAISRKHADCIQPVRLQLVCDAIKGIDESVLQKTLEARVREDMSSLDRRGKLRLACVFDPKTNQERAEWRRWVRTLARRF